MIMEDFKLVDIILFAGGWWVWPWYIYTT